MQAQPRLPSPPVYHTAFLTSTQDRHGYSPKLTAHARSVDLPHGAPPTPPGAGKPQGHRVPCAQSVSLPHSAQLISRHAGRDRATALRLRNCRPMHALQHITCLRATAPAWGLLEVQRYAQPTLQEPQDTQSMQTPIGSPTTSGLPQAAHGLPCRTPVDWPSERTTPVFQTPSFQPQLSARMQQAPESPHPSARGAQRSNQGSTPHHRAPTP